MMNEKHIEQVLELERQAQEIHDAAVREAQQLPILAEQDAQAIIGKTVAEAREEARRLVEKAQAEEETARILRESESKNQQMDQAAKKNFELAVNYILNQVIGAK
jgi:vacuolar-type H+-ATPase subunit H